jgi:hypothetical protein
MPGITNYSGMPYTQYGIASNSQQLITMNAGTVVLGDVWTITIEGVAASYTAIAADVTAGGSSSTLGRLAAAVNAVATWPYDLYPNGATLTAMLIAVTSQDNNYRISTSFSGSGTTRLTAAGPTLVGGSGGMVNNINGNISYYVHPDETAS